MNPDNPEHPEHPELLPPACCLLPVHGKGLAGEQRRVGFSWKSRWSNRNQDGNSSSQLPGEEFRLQDVTGSMHGSNQCRRIQLKKPRMPGDCRDWISWPEQKVPARAPVICNSNGRTIVPRGMIKIILINICIRRLNVLRLGCASRLVQTKQGVAAFIACK